ncbi:MAG: hypothetical protein A2X49_15050 [Lentisphaerae bacterium GWF2_52_8]|nr:MAG: hypothetical protein A2X49_15050 [Lentisphaerae bacterium GWF2_52_8]
MTSSTRHHFITKTLAELEEQDLRRQLRPVEPVSAREGRLPDGRIVLNFSSNDYLGLSRHPALSEESIAWTRRLGTGSTASRLVCGTFPELVKLEEEIARWKGEEAALVLGAGYLANTGAIAALAGRDTQIFADKLNHASLNAGCQLAGAEFLRYRHNEPAHLEKLLASSDSKRKLIVSDTVFSMDGDCADINSLKELAERHDALLYLDDAHASGLFGKGGSGLAGHGNCDLAMGTFSKALGSYGAYIACSRQMKDFLVNRCGSLIYTTALPPAVLGANAAAVRLVQTPEYDAIRSRLLSSCKKLRSELNSLGYDTGAGSTPIIPIIAGEAQTAKNLSEFLLERGILAIPIRPPSVPRGTARLRLTVNAAHTSGDLALLLSALSEARKAII